MVVGVWLCTVVSEGPEGSQGLEGTECGWKGRMGWFEGWE